METKYYKFLSNFIVKSKRERLIYELQSEKKRENAFSKMTNFLDCFHSKDIIVDLTVIVKYRRLGIVGGVVCHTAGSQTVTTSSPPIVRVIN